MVSQQWGRSWRERVAGFFEAWGRRVVDRPGRTIVVVGLVTALLASFTPGLRIDESLEAYLHPDDPALQHLEDLRDRFGREDTIVVGVGPGEVFEVAFLQKLEALHRALEEEVPHVEKVVSLVNARRVRPGPEGVVIEALMDEVPSRPAQVAELRERVLGNPLYEGSLVSEEGDFTAVVLRPYAHSAGAESGEGGEAKAPDAEPTSLNTAEGEALVAGLKRVLQRLEGPDFQLHPVGWLVSESWLRQTLRHDSEIYVTLSFAVIFAALFLLFRRIPLVVGPLVVVGSALLSTLGLMVLLGISLTGPLQILPNLLLVAGIGDSVHLITILQRRMGDGMEKREAIIAALRRTGLPLLLTSLTTAGGLFSFAAAELAPVSHVGILGSAGILLAFAYSVTLLPALLAVSPLRASRSAPSANAGLRRLLGAAAGLGVRHSNAVLAVALLLALVAAVGASRLHFSDYALAWLPEGDRFREDTLLVDEKLGGIYSLEFVVDAGSSGALHEPEWLHSLDRASRRIEALDREHVSVVQAFSVADLVQGMHRALQGGDAGENALPDSRGLAAQEFLLLEGGGGDLARFVDPTLRWTRLSVQVPWVDSFHYIPLIEDAEQVLRETLPEEAGWTATGLAAVTSRTFVAVVESMTRSYGFALAVVAPLVLLYVGHLRLGLLALVPNLLPILLTLGLMGVLGIPLDVTTLLVGGIVIGIAVDDTIHFIHHFTEEWRQRGDPREAVQAAVETVGPALFCTTTILGAGFLVFLFGYMENTSNFGLLAAFATTTAFMADVVLAPALLLRFAPQVEQEEWSATESVLRPLPKS